MPSQIKQLIGMRGPRGQGSAAITSSAWSTMARWENKDSKSAAETTCCQGSGTSLYVKRQVVTLRELITLTSILFLLSSALRPFN